MTTDGKPRGQPNLLADCASCFGLCCVALPFAASTDFAIDKPAGEPCTNLQNDFRCGIHPTLRTSGFTGCTVYDCFGAGQQVSQVTFGGTDWRSEPDTATEMFSVFPVVRQLHELLFYLEQVLTLAPAAELHDAVRDALASTRALAGGTPAAILDMDLPAHRASVDLLLRQGSALTRRGFRAGPDGSAQQDGQGGSDRKGPAGRTSAGVKNAPGKDLSRCDLIGADLSGADLRGTDLRGSYLIGADLHAADLRLADLIGADLRATDLGAADLSTSLFLTQFQVNAARGDAATLLPPGLARPGHWGS